LRRHPICIRELKWFSRYGAAVCPALQCSSDGIDRFLTRCTQLGLQRSRAGDRIYSPIGFDELERMIVRPELTVVSPADLEVTK
jgi:hypothetical protein